MKNQIKSIVAFISFTILTTPTPAFAQNNAGLQVQVSNIESAKGKIMVAVFNSEKTFLKESVICGLGYRVESTSDIVITIPDIPFGKYALSIYHDKNDNGELNTNFLGIPKEPYGFSNNAKGTFGPPSYADAVFNFEKDGQVINIDLK